MFLEIFIPQFIYLIMSKFERQLFRVRKYADICSTPEYILSLVSRVFFFPELIYHSAFKEAVWKRTFGPSERRSTLSTQVRSANGPLVDINIDGKVDGRLCERGVNSALRHPGSPPISVPVVLLLAYLSSVRGIKRVSEVSPDGATARKKPRASEGRERR